MESSLPGVRAVSTAAISWAWLVGAPNDPWWHHDWQEALGVGTGDGTLGWECSCVGL
jgi:hypothetical protein